jgi:hypothetical protein
MFNYKHIQEPNTVGDGTMALATKEYSIKLQVIQRNDATNVIVLYSCKYLPSLFKRLFSIPKK